MAVGSSSNFITGSARDAGGRFSGLPGLLKQLDKFASDVQRKAMNTAMNAAMRQMKKDAQRMAPKKSGDLRKAIKVKKEKFDSGILRSRLFVNYKGAKGAPYAHLVHDGTKKRKVKNTYWFRGRGYVLFEKGQSLGSVKPDPFMEKAFNKNKLNAQREFSKALQRAIKRASK